MCTAVLIGWDPAPPPSPCFWAQIRGRYWSAKIDDISLWPPGHNLLFLSFFDQGRKWTCTACPDSVAKLRVSGNSSGCTATAVPFKYSFSGKSAASAPISTLMCLWAIYVFPGSVHIFPPAEKADPLWEYIIRSQTHECGNWDWGPDIPFLGIFVSNFQHFVFAVWYTVYISVGTGQGTDQGQHSLKGHGNEADFLGFLQKLIPHKSLTLLFEPFRFWLRIRGDIRNRKTTPPLAESAFECFKR
jgi:hypothetical protein